MGEMHPQHPREWDPPDPHSLGVSLAGAGLLWALLPLAAHLGLSLSRSLSHILEMRARELLRDRHLGQVASTAWFPAAVASHY